jgi:hypothetical protein
MGNGGSGGVTLSESDITQLELNYTRTTTNAELAIGNREIVEIKSANGVFTVEKGRLKICAYYDLEKGELFKFYNSDLQNLLKLKNKNAKAFNTSGSDSGRSITINVPPKQFRKEVRCSERVTLSGPDKQQFENIEQQLSKFNLDHIQAKQMPVKITFDGKLAAEFLEVTQEPFALSYKLNKWKNAVIVMTGGDNGDVTVEQVYLPKGVPIEIQVGAFSLMGGDEDTRKFSLSNSVTLTNETSIRFSHKDQELIMEVGQ